MSLASRNLRLFVAFRATTRALLFAPYIQFFVVETRGLSDAQYGALQGIYYLVVVLTEVPSGVVADRFGRKAVLLAGALAAATGCFLFAVARDFTLFVVAEVAFGLSTALVSGADSALLYDSLAADGRQHEYARAEGAAQSSWLLLTALGLPLADRYLVVDRNPVLAYWVTGAIMLLGAGAALAMREPPRRRATLREITLGALSDAARVPGIARVILYSIGLFALLRASVVMLFHPALAAQGIPVDGYGKVLAAVNVAGALAAWRAHLWLRRRERAFLVALPVAMLWMFLLLATLRAPAAALLFCVQGAVFGVYPLVIRSLLNRLVPSAERRATVLSLESLACRVAFAPLALFTGWATGALGFAPAMAGTALLACIPFALLPLLPRPPAEPRAAV